MSYSPAGALLINKVQITSQRDLTVSAIRTTSMHEASLSPQRYMGTAQSLTYSLLELCHSASDLRRLQQPWVAKNDASNRLLLRNSRGKGYQPTYVPNRGASYNTPGNFHRGHRRGARKNVVYFLPVNYWILIDVVVCVARGCRGAIVTSTAIDHK